MAFAAALKARCPSLGGSARERSAVRRRILFWSFAAIASVVATVAYGLPALSTRLAPLVPWSTEAALGRAVEARRSASLAAARSAARRAMGRASAPSPP